MSDSASHDADLVRRARAAHAAGDLDAARRSAGELWLRYQQQAYVASRRRARGSEADEVFGHLQLRFIQWVYYRDTAPQNMTGLLNQMALYAYGDVQRTEAGEAPTVEEIDDYGDRDLDRRGNPNEVALNQLLDRDLIEQLLPVLNERERILIDRMLEDAPDAAIAAELGVDPNNLHQIRFRALKRLRDEARTRELTA